MSLVLKSSHTPIGTNLYNGNVLQGEKDMYDRIIRDCEASPLTWYMWYDKSFSIPYNGQQEIQIDFLLICQEGAIIIEVKGGPIEIIRGYYYYYHKGILTEMKRSPFEQANHYKWALINNGVLKKDVIFVDYACAFPHSDLEKTSNTPADDLSYKLWNKAKHDSDASFADFCLSVLRKRKKSNRILTAIELESVVNSLAPTIEDNNKYSLTSLKEVLDWLHIDNLSVLEGLRKNPRLMIEGGPGTGKTTMAKAFIKRHRGLNGIYLCWTGLLASKVKLDLDKERLDCCIVKTYNNFIKDITNQTFSIEERSGETTFRDDLQKALTQAKDLDFDYIIIDEAQDVADKGIDLILNKFFDFNQYGQSLVFYDIEQGYNSIKRNLFEVLNCMTEHAACFVLDENKRVPTNKRLVDYANKVFSIEHTQDSYNCFLKALEQETIPGLTILTYNNTRDVKKAIKNQAASLKLFSGDLSSTTLLIHSDLRNNNDDETPFDSIAEMDLLIPLSEKTIERKSKESLAFTTILKYKGLEDNNIILVLPQTKKWSSWDNFLFEIYVGMTRAIMNLSIIILAHE